MKKILIFLSVLFCVNISIAQNEWGFGESSFSISANAETYTFRDSEYRIDYQEMVGVDIAFHHKKYNFELESTFSIKSDLDFDRQEYRVSSILYYDLIARLFSEKKIKAQLLAGFKIDTNTEIEGTPVGVRLSYEPSSLFIRAGVSKNAFYSTHNGRDPIVFSVSIGKRFGYMNKGNR